MNILTQPTKDNTSDCRVRLFSMFVYDTFQFFSRSVKFWIRSFFRKRIHPQSRSFERRICAQTQDLKIFKKFNLSQMNPKEVFHNTAYSVQLPYMAGHSL